jgi:hypothetical protein
VDRSGAHAAGRRPEPPGRRATLAADEITTLGGIPVTTPAGTLLDLAAILTPPEVERAANEAEVRRLTSPTSLADLVARYPRRPGTPKIRALLEARRIGAQITRQELEHRFLAFLDAHRDRRGQLHDDPGALAAELRRLLRARP